MIQFPDKQTLENWKTIASLTDISLDGVEAVAADIDYTLVDFDPAHQAGIDALAKLYGLNLAQLVESYFRLILEGFRKPESEPWSQRNNFENLLAQMKDKQIIDETHHFKVWSREAWLQIASEVENSAFTTATLTLARDTYWLALEENVSLFTDAAAWVAELSERQIPLILMTGSDSVLTIQPDGSLLYDPDFSDRYKRQRLTSLPFDYHELLIGDPIDKPHPAFFDKVRQALEKHGATNPGNIVFVGDSPRNDLQVPAERGYQTYFIKRK